jgi:hypothetical protein
MVTFSHYPGQGEMPDYFDLSQLLGGQTQPNGLLTADANVNQNTLMAAGAAMMKAAGPSPYRSKMTTAAGLGDALSAALTSRQASTDNALKQRLVASQIQKNQNDNLLPALKMAAEYQANGLPIPPQLQRILAGIGTPGVQQQGAPPPASGASSGGVSAVGATGLPSAPQNAPAGLPQGAPGAGTAAPAPQAGGQSPADVLRAAGINPAALVTAGPLSSAAQALLTQHYGALDPAKSANEQQAAIMKQQTEQYGKKYAATQALGTTGLGVAELMDDAMAIAERPDFASKTGLGAETQQMWDQLKAKFGGDPAAPFSLQAFKKIFSEALLQRTQMNKDESAELGPAGRQFLQSINIMASASPNGELNFPTNLYLMDQMKREGLRHAGVADEAAKYSLEKGRLDNGWDIQERKYLKDHPLYSDKERENVTASASPYGAPATGPAGAAVPAVPGQGPAAGPAPVPGQGPAAPAASSLRAEDRSAPPPGAMHRAIGPNGQVIYLNSQGKVIQ